MFAPASLRTAPETRAGAPPKIATQLAPVAPLSEPPAEAEANAEYRARVARGGVTLAELREYAVRALESDHAATAVEILYAHPALALRLLPYVEACVPRALAILLGAVASVAGAFGEPADRAAAAAVAERAGRPALAARLRA